MQSLRFAIHTEFLTVTMTCIVRQYPSSLAMFKHIITGRTSEIEKRTFLRNVPSRMLRQSSDLYGISLVMVALRPSCFRASQYCKNDSTITERSMVGSAPGVPYTLVAVLEKLLGSSPGICAHTRDHVTSLPENHRPIASWLFHCSDNTCFCYLLRSDLLCLCSLTIGLCGIVTILDDQILRLVVVATGEVALQDCLCASSVSFLSIN